MIKKILLALAILLVLIQFIRPTKNNTKNHKYAIYLKYPLPIAVAPILKRACMDCHSNSTQYPWYTNVQPLGWWLASHIKEGKKNFNVSEFSNRSVAYHYHKFEEIKEVVEKKEMPLPSYTWFGLHPEANLTDEQRDILTTWAQTQLDNLTRQYPADSLVMKKR